MDDKFEQFKTLYKKFVNGTAWLNKRMADGIDVEQDKKEFLSSVVAPLDALWVTLTKEDQDYWSKVDKAVKVLKGTIV